MLCETAYKVHDRLDPSELRRNADRLRPKDFADLYRLLLTIVPEQVAGVFTHGIADPKISDAVALGRHYLVVILTDASTSARMVAGASREAGFHAHIDSWRRRFTA